MRIGVLTGGGDCPGLNAAIRAVVRKGVIEYDDEFIGFKNGWKGILEQDYQSLSLKEVRGILPLGGTILGSSRTNPFKREDGADTVKKTFEDLSLDGLIAIGGEDTLGVAHKLYKLGFPVIGLPKTIDNDLNGTDLTFGFDTALQIATEAIDRLTSTSASHARSAIVEIMGRHAGWLALHAGIAGGADVILIPEQPFDIDEVCNHVRRRYELEKPFSIIAVAEGAIPKEGTLEVISHGEDEFGHARLGGIGHLLETEIEKRTGFETRATVLGHIQRGGSPTAFDRVLATRCGLKAIEAAHNSQWGYMAAMKGSNIQMVPLEEAVGKLKTVPLEQYQEAQVFFG